MMTDAPQEGLTNEGGSSRIDRRLDRQTKIKAFEELETKFISLQDNTNTDLAIYNIIMKSTVTLTQP